MIPYDKEDVKTFHEKGLMWMVFGILIPSDTFAKLKEYEDSIRILGKLQKSIPEADINQEDKDKYLEKANKVMDLLQKEYEEKKKKIEKRKKYAKNHKSQQPKEIKVTDGKFYL